MFKNWDIALILYFKVSRSVDSLAVLMPVNSKAMLVVRQKICNEALDPFNILLVAVLMKYVIIIFAVTIPLISSISSDFYQNNLTYQFYYTPSIIKKQEFPLGN